MDWHTKLYGRRITHTGLDSLGISVENLRKTKALNKGKLNRYSYHQIMMGESKDFKMKADFKNRI